MLSGNTRKKDRHVKSQIKKFLPSNRSGTYHITLFGTKENLKKPGVVFDRACKSEGVSLNSQFLQGPENSSSLLGVILRFRVNSVAVAADIKRMLSQVFVSPEDRGALCYLWWPDGDLKKDPKTFQMLVHIFGATTSPSICGYALRRTAAHNSKGFSSETIDAVMRDFYVDDLLKSFDTTSRAVEITKELQELLAKGGF